MTGLSSEDFCGLADLAYGFRRYFRTHSYCSHPFRGKSRLTDFHFGWPFFVSHSRLVDTTWANRPTVSQLVRRKSNETRTAFTVTVSTGCGCHAYVFAGITTRG